MRATMGCGQYDGQWVYYGLSTAFEMFLIFTIQLYAFLCNCNAKALIFFTLPPNLHSIIMRQVNQIVNLIACIQ